MPKQIDPAEYAKPNTEHAHQTALFMSIAPLYGEHPDLKLLFAIPNGGLRDKITAGRLKAEGVKSGVPDLMLPVASRSWHGLFIELKRIKTNMKREGIVGTNQIDWKVALSEKGYYVATCYGWIEARSVLFWYLKLGMYSDG
jgi:hypothetical protein